MAVKKDIAINCGADYRQTIELRLSTGQLLPLAGYTARTQCREDFDSPTTLWDLTSANGTVELGDGLVSFLVSPALSDAVQAADITRAVWDLELVSPGGKVTRLAAGKVYFSFQVTRPA